MTVRRTLPQRERSLIGAWCFVDHYGPDDVTETGGMTVPPHPHTGLQTVSWLFEGEVEHRDSSGAHAMVRPGDVNLMTAGQGIQHSEVSTPQTQRLHGAQLWVALPDRDRHVAPFFEHAEPEPITIGAATLRVFVGEFAGSASPVRTFTALIGAQLDLPAGASVELPLDPSFEYGVLVDAGIAHLDATEVPRNHLGYTAPGRSSVRIAAGDAPLRALLLGGEPLGEPIVMWWNFIARDHDEIVALREQWQAEVIEGGTDAGRFGIVKGWNGRALPAPVMPDVRLRPRD
jgi:redox-sensitive bicupin YhaK (pirin superfamily)